MVFTDVVDSTALMQRLGPRADDARRAHFGALRTAIADTGGVEVKTLGDGVMVAFESVTGAVACSVAMQRAVSAANRRAELPLRIRVGVSLGDVTVEEDDYFGVPVIEAARLCAAAGAGQILVSDLVHRIAGDRDRARPVGELDLKGLPEPVAAFEVAWETKAADGAPLPSALARAAAGGTFAGRRDELALLEREWARAVAGERRVVLVSGEPGVGKTRLAAELAQRLHDEGAVVLYGRCEAELTGPFWPIAEALHQLVEVLDVNVLREHVRVHGGELCRLVPELSRRLPGVPPPRAADPDRERLRLFDAVLGLLDAAARSAPLLLVLDDLQWADRPSLQLLLHMARGTEADLLVVAPHRAAAFDWTEAFRAVLGDLVTEPATTQVGLSGLGDADTVTLLEDAVGHAVGASGAALARRLRRETEGNPFYVKELLRDLEDSGHLLEERALRRLASDPQGLEVPLTVQHVVSQRVARLGPEVVRALGTAAVLGRAFDFEVLARVAETPETALLDALDAACDAGIAAAVRDHPGRFSFSHALVAHALTEAIGPLRRQRIHRRVAEVLEAVAGDDRTAPQSWRGTGSPPATGARAWPPRCAPATGR